MAPASTEPKQDLPQTPEAPDPVAVLRDSRLVDAEWYLATYPDVAAAGVDPVEHYLTAGAAEGRNPNAFFDGTAYLDANPDLREAGVDPLMHYLLSGAREGRSAGPEFDTAFYIAENPEVADSGFNPLAHFLDYGRHEGRRPKPRDEAEAFEVGMRAKREGLTGPAAALYRGPRADHVHFPLVRRSTEPEQQGLPLPPLDLAQRIGSVTLEDFESSGRGIRDTIVRALPPGFSWSGARCLDFGSGVGRALRHFVDEAEEAEFWGCDIDGSSIRWSVQNLCPPFRFFQISEVPTIPFEDNSFDLVYAVSVLSHIHTDWQQWLMEIRRILKPGGTFFVSFMGQTPFEEMLGLSYWEQGSDFGMYVKNPHNNWNAGGPMIFVSPAWIKAFWGSLFDIDYIAMDGLIEYQSFCVMRKPIQGAALRQWVPVLKLSTSQAFNPHAVGRILPQINEELHFRDSYGLDLPATGQAALRGWIVFRSDEPKEAAILVDGRLMPSEVVFDAEGAYRDWDGTLRYSFDCAVDLAALSPGAHKLKARFKSAKGLSHSLTIPLLIR